MGMGRALINAVSTDEEVPCPLCASDQPQRVYQLEDWQHGLGGPFSLVRCGACGALYLTPRPSEVELARYYPRDYEPYQPHALTGGLWWRRLPRLYGLDKRCRAVTHLLASGRLLDIGCAAGDFMVRMRQHGAWDVAGIEPDACAAQYARERYDLQVYTGRVDEVELPEAQFDVVTLWDVLEHLPQPGASLQRIARWLRPGGWLLLRTPDAASFYARAWGRYWAGLDAPRHLVVFDRTSLERLLMQSGFQVARAWSLSGSHALTVLSWRYWLRARGHALGWSRLLDNPLTQALTAPLFWLIDRRGGALVTVAARKQTEERLDRDSSGPAK
jgi:2-polyprenyl-3-methyl-5-hydroxy-6-metoxy-1,4-benzoquinol methylase